MNTTKEKYSKTTPHESIAIDHHRRRDKRTVDKTTKRVRHKELCDTISYKGKAKKNNTGGHKGDGALGKFKGNRTSLTKEATKEYKTNSFGVWRRIGERKDKARRKASGREGIVTSSISKLCRHSSGEPIATPRTPLTQRGHASTEHNPTSNNQTRIRENNQQM